jgi:hypothetical protein
MVSGAGAIIRPQRASPIEKKHRVRGIDVAKQIFHVVGMDETGEIVLRKRLTRQVLQPFIV